jgi:antitoxin component HigA of HigAB toxin-antitoxin module
MAKVKKEEVVEETIQETPPVEEVAEEQKPEIDLEKFESKDDPEVIKVDLGKPGADEKQTDLEESIEEVTQEEDVDGEVPTLEEVTDEVVTEEEVIEALDANEETGKAIPENVQKLMDFMNETGGDLQDYVNLNRDVKDLDNQEALLEYYKRTKPHLDSEEINFMMEDNFSFDEDIDDERDIKRKKLALKEQVAEAKTYLDGQKSKYYEEIKAGSKLTVEQQKAINFFDRYNKESEQTQKVAQQQKSRFNKKTEQVFNDKFKGFEYNVGDKRFRYNVKDAGQVKETQSDINNFVKKFLNEDNTMSDAKGYHKSLYTAMNADAVAQHFYEQGKADALKDSVAKAKNINTTARPSHGEAQTGGMKVRVLGDDTASFKFKMKNKK